MFQTQTNKSELRAIFEYKNKGMNKTPYPESEMKHTNNIISGLKTELWTPA